VTTLDASGAVVEMPEPRGIGSKSLNVLSIVFNKRFVGLWLLVVLSIVFSLSEPTLFPTKLTVEAILGNEAVIGLLALGVMFPLIAGIFDLGIAWVAGLSLCLVAKMSLQHHFSFPILILIALGVGAAMGSVSALLVGKWKVNSLVTTLGVGSLALGIAEWLAAGFSLTPQLPSTMITFGQGHLFGIIPNPFVYLLVVTALMYYVLEHTALGRRIRAAGINQEAARLAGIRVRRIEVGVLILSGIMSGFAGLVLAAQVGSANSSTAPAYLLPAISAVFLGAMQLKDGPNPWGTIVAVLLLGTGVEGLELWGASTWVSDFFNGVVLLISVTIAGRGLLARIT